MTNSRVVDREGQYTPWRFVTPCGHSAWTRNHSRRPDHPHAITCLTCKNDGQEQFRYPVSELVDKREVPADD